MAGQGLVACGGSSRNSPHKFVSQRRRHLPGSGIVPDGAERSCWFLAASGRTASPTSVAALDVAALLHADVAQLAERDLPKVDVASSNLAIRSTARTVASQGCPVRVV